MTSQDGHVGPFLNYTFNDPIDHYTYMLPIRSDWRIDIEMNDVKEGDHKMRMYEMLRMDVFRDRYKHAPVWPLSRN